VRRASSNQLASPVNCTRTRGLWAIATSATNSIAKAMIAAIVPRAQRGRAYGLYYLVFGVAWWAGSLLLGALYDRSPALAGVVATAALLLGAATVMWSGMRDTRQG